MQTRSIAKEAPGTSVREPRFAAPATPIARVVELNERAKVLRRYAFEVGLRALGAIVRSRLSDSALRGFDEVATQMRGWSRELEAAVREINALSTQRVRVVSDVVKATRLSTLIGKASDAQGARRFLGDCSVREQDVLGRHRAQLRRLDDRLSETIDAVAQLGMMASVLSRAALIEAAGGGALQRHELSISAREFAAYAAQVNEVVSAMTALIREPRS